MRFLVLLLIICASSSAFAQDNLINKIQQLEQGIVTVSTELVKIQHNDNDKDRRVVTYSRTGSGVVIDSSGIIVTNTHTIINAPYIWVILADGTKYQADVIGVNMDYDFSLLKINPPSPLIAIQLADSNSAHIDDEIIAIGSSELNQSSMLSGKITSIVQNKTTGNTEFVEVRLNLYKGDSGGPVFDRNGRLLGIVMAKHKMAEDKGVIIASNKIRDEYWNYRKNVP